MVPTYLRHNSSDLLADDHNYNGGQSNSADDKRMTEKFLNFNIGYIAAQYVISLKCSQLL